MLRAHRLSEDSNFLGQACALCKQPFDIGDVIVVCPVDGSRHHDHCWRANGNHCTAYGCTGQGEIGVSVGSGRRRTPAEAPQPVVISEPQAQSRAPGSPSGSKVRVFPARNFGCARSCLFLFIVLTLVLVGATCFGLYTFADSIFRELSSQGPTLPTAALIPLRSLLTAL